MLDNLTITPLVAIGGQCNYCKIDLDAIVNIYQEVKGKFIYFTCDGCNHDYRLAIEEGN